MDIKQDDYVEGTEYYGFNNQTRKSVGWVDAVHQMGAYTIYDIQADDSYGGARGTSFNTELGEVVKLAPKERPFRI